MKYDKLSPVNFSRRFTAFIIDGIIVGLLRGLAMHFMVLYWLNDSMIKFANGFKFVFGENLKASDLSDIHIRFFMQSELFPKFLNFVLILISIGFIYNLIMLSTKWSATIGQKIMSIFNISKNNKKMRWYQILSRSFLAVLPFNIIFLMLMYQVFGSMMQKTILTPQAFVIVVGFGLLVWYDMFFFTKDKILMHGLLTKTKVVKKGNYKNGFFDIVFSFIDNLSINSKKLFKKAKKNLKKEPKKKTKKSRVTKKKK